MIAAAVRIALGALVATALLGAADLSDKQKERFLREAEVIAAKEISTGITRPQRLTLTDGKLTHDAHFQSIDEFKPIFEGPRGAEINFRDTYRYNIAAYRLDRLLELGMTPVSIERKYRGHTGACTWWVDDVMMMERDRWEREIAPPDPEVWNLQMYQVRIFNELVYNTDPNLGNVLIDKSWRLWMVDFTRAFRIFKKLRQSDNLDGVRIDRRVWRNLQKLDDPKLRKTMGAMLLETEREALLARRDIIVETLRERMAREGEDAVLCDLPWR